MISLENLLSFLDLLDLDEELIDTRLKSIMNKEKYTNKHLTSAIQLLQYKNLVNLQDNDDCPNDEECEFVARLIKEINAENVENVCKIISITLGLNKITLVSRSEHLLQQILSDLHNQVDSDEALDSSKSILTLKITDSILEAVIKNNQKLYLPFLEVPIKNILLCSNENIKVHFLSCTVPKLFDALTGFNILDSLWDFITHLETENRSISLKVLSLLSDYYLPTQDNKGIVLFESNIVHQGEFWWSILYGILSHKSSLRKMSIYLAKRALECVIRQKKDVFVTSKNMILFKWSYSENRTLKIMWDNYFILIDSLEEKQSNIVLPSLQLFSSLKDMGHWLNCAFNIGLKHDNTQVRLKCIHYRLDMKLCSQPEAVVLLEALNNINIYDKSLEVDELKGKLSMFLRDEDVFVYIFQSIPLIKWSPVPFYHITSILGNLKLKSNIKLSGQQIKAIIKEILNIPCNNIALRKAAHTNVSHFVGNCCTGLNWEDYVNIYLCLKTDVLNNNCSDNPFMSVMSEKLRNEDKEIFCEFLLQSYLNIDLALHYLEQHEDMLSLYIDLLCEKIEKISEIAGRQYSDKRETLNDVIYLTQLIYKTHTKENTSMKTINAIILSKLKTILLYVSSLLVNNIMLTIDGIALVTKGLHYMSNVVNVDEIKEELLQLYKTSVLFIKSNNVSLESIVYSLHLVHCLSNNTILLTYYQHEMLSLQDILALTTKFDNKQSIGRLRNVFYEKSCEIIVLMLNQQKSEAKRCVKDIAEYIEVVLECGGYGCLRWCLKIMNKILPFMITNKNINFNMGQFISRIWREIEELKSNSQYMPCIEEFVNLITHDQLLKTPEHNNIVTLYCQKIIDYGSIKPTPLYYLICKLNSKVVTGDYGHVNYILCEVLLYSPVPRKDQRITEKLVLEVMKEPKYGFQQSENHTHFNFQIKYLAVLALSKIKDPEIIYTIEKFIMNRIKESFKTKQRYHGHSQAHRLLLAGLQHLLLMSLMKTNNSMETLNWCVEFLQKLPHQPSVRICLEWYIALQLFIKGIILNEKLLQRLNDIPQTSQLLILYWTGKQIMSRAHKRDVMRDFGFVMDLLLHHTMGQIFTTRLYAQYLATKLYAMLKQPVSDYTSTIKVIGDTLKDNSNDKNYIKVKNDYFLNDFEIIKDITPCFLYQFLPRYCENNYNEIFDIDYVKDILKEVSSNIAENLPSTDFHEEWLDSHRSDEEVFNLNISKDEFNKVTENVEATGTIQKKYVPWKNMSDVNVYETEKKKENRSGLIVVASLIDKLPNLGGMARTSEVFGVKTYVVDSLRHLQDKQFQSLSVSAERWIDVEEVHPGRLLKEYLIAKKSEGYCIVAAEQTSTSVQLQAFRFPIKTLLLLGHEKEGVPCDLLPIMDYCVEIPQQGFVRSLNVHVTASIFIWEYARQNIL